MSAFAIDEAVPRPNEDLTKEPNSSQPAGKARRISLLIGLLILAGLIVFVLAHPGQGRQMLDLLKQAQPVWLLAAIGLQAGTYVCAGGVWHRVLSRAGLHLPLSVMARLSVQKLLVDQLVPTAGMGGS